jgi:hypothetical protein
MPKYLFSLFNGMIPMISLINRNAVKLMGMVLALLMGGQFSLAQAPAKTGKDAETLKAANAIFFNIGKISSINYLLVFVITIVLSIKSIRT